MKMWTKRSKLWRFMLCMFLAVSALALTRADDDVPLESQCRPYIEKALKELESGDSEPGSGENKDSSEISIDNNTNEDISLENGEASANEENSKESLVSNEEEIDVPSIEVADEPYVSQVSYEDGQENEDENESNESMAVEENEEVIEEKAADNDGDSNEAASADEQDEKESQEDGAVTSIQEDSAEKQSEIMPAEETSTEDSQEDTHQESQEEGDNAKSVEADEQESESSEIVNESGNESEEKTNENGESQEDLPSSDTLDKDEKDESKEQSETEEGDESQENIASEETVDVSKEDIADPEKVDDDNSQEENKSDEESAEEKGTEEKETSSENLGEENVTDEEAQEYETSKEDDDAKSEEGNEGNSAETGSEEERSEGAPEEDLLLTGEIPENLRSREHIIQILRLDEEASEAELIVEKSADIILRDLKRLYEGSIKPLEGLYKYRDLSNRHFGDPEIFSKPLVLFMGPWSGGKSSILNYLTGLEFTEWSLRTGAEPSPAYFNILMHGKDPEVLDGTQLAADWTFSGLQKFGQGLEERLRGLKYPSKLLEKVNIVEIPGILEVRKQVSRVFPFNDACQWFIDRADIIFLVYDPSKLDVGPETEAILDQLKGRESQTRIVLNKADIVKPEELMRVQSALIWNISPLMSSPQPPVMYTVSLWSMPFDAGAPVRLLLAQERELLRDLRQAIDKRIENKIASARRFAVRVRNHAKMVDCYLTTYYNHKTIFGNRKLIADAIIENPQNYHIYEGLSTLTNISRYDLPDPETYRDFFRLNPLYEFQQLSATCTYFRGCPITKLDVAIAYDLPELVGKYKKMVETATPQGMPKT
ncbi:sarcalumenin [Leptidea sinapis]|uniref:sarcalumenin n=1 Tax=Leptidea sinapis TaxID=189913 RepID=UPI0021413B4A|nr:sarcalumenin [Leptidea sinapis]XP_050672417.1 sarcalumenin [Leptidea sinapis]XP_050672418.1 sarcalumenin [Leptidea sinapis]